MQHERRISIARTVRMLVVIAVVGVLTVAADEPPRYSDWSAPQNLGAIINGDGNDSGPCISRDGLSLFFNSNRPGGFGGLDIYVSHRPSRDAPWGPPENLGPNVNSSADDNASALSPDEHRLYFQSNRAGGFGGPDLYVARRHNRRDDLSWQLAENLGNVINTSSIEGGPVYFEDETSGLTTLYFQSNRPGGFGLLDIYASVLQLDETWGPPQLVQELSTVDNDQQLAIRRDGLEMFITSNRPGSVSTLGDIWVSTRARTSDPWSAPEDAGPVLNAPAPSFQGRPSLSFDGRTLYFYAFRPGGFGAQDLYVSMRTKMKD